MHYAPVGIVNLDEFVRSTRFSVEMMLKARNIFRIMGDLAHVER